MLLNVEEVNQIISSSPRKNGCYNLFFKINDKIGIKLTTTRSHRDRLYERQTECAKLGLGPETYGTIDRVKYDREEYWGYFTEIVEVFDENVNDISYEEYDEWFSLLRNDVRALKADLSSVFCFSDLHLGNIGFKNGKMVCIDFDASCDDSDLLGYSNTF